MSDTDSYGYKLAVVRLKKMADLERWKSENGPAREGSEIADGFKFRAETLEQAVKELLNWTAD